MGPAAKHIKLSRTDKAGGRGFSRGEREAPLLQSGEQLLSRGAVRVSRQLAKPSLLQKGKREKKKGYLREARPHDGRVMKRMRTMFISYPKKLALVFSSRKWRPGPEKLESLGKLAGRR